MGVWGVWEEILTLPSLKAWRFLVHWCQLNMKPLSSLAPTQSMGAMILRLRLNLSPEEAAAHQNAFPGGAWKRELQMLQGSRYD